MLPTLVQEECSISLTALQPDLGESLVTSEAASAALQMATARKLTPKISILTMISTQMRLKFTDDSKDSN